MKDFLLITLVLITSMTSRANDADVCSMIVYELNIAEIEEKNSYEMLEVYKELAIQAKETHETSMEIISIGLYKGSDFDSLLAQTEAEIITYSSIIRTLEAFKKAHILLEEKKQKININYSSLKNFFTLGARAKDVTEKLAVYALDKHVLYTKKAEYLESELIRRNCSEYLK